MAGLAKPFLREVPTTHLCGSLASIRREYLSAPLDRGGTICELGEDGRWPVAYIRASYLQPPIARIWILQAKNYWRIKQTVGL